MKNRQHLFLLLVTVAVFLLGCSLLNETTTPATAPATMIPTTPANPVASPTNTVARPAKSTKPPATAILATITTTTETTAQAPLATVTLVPPVATIVGEENPSQPSDGNVTIPAPPATTVANIDNPLIKFFSANVQETDPGGSITLNWSTTNAITVTLWHLAATGQFSEFWTVAESGSFEYPVAMRERNQTTFALSALDALGNHEMVTVAVALRCPDEWFFANPPDICPATAATYSAAAEQQFERGTMIWIAEENRIYVLFGDGLQYAWEAYIDAWSQGVAENDPGLAPPSGLYQPVRGFGLVWREQPGVMDRLGWAVAEEIAFESVVQRTSYAKYNETYIRALDGALWRLMAERSDWVKLYDGGNS